jgi:release factor glutamine methyltransferase
MIPQPTIKVLLLDAAQRLQGIDTARLDAEVLLAKVLGVDRGHLYSHDDDVAEAGQQARYIQMLNERARGKPIAHIIGSREFWSMSLQINQHTLIPRPETEHLVECALDVIPEEYACNLADLGTGSGAIALAIARERPRCKIIATDISEQALTVATRNATRLGIHNISFQQGDWCKALRSAKVEVLVSNPPYIEENDPHLTQGDVRFEPRSALVSGADGLDAITQIVSQCHHHLRPGGWLMLEHGYQQAEAVRELMKKHQLVSIKTYPDHAGLDRVTVAKRPYNQNHE